jgi:opacity protein-like surface antigen
MHTRKVCKLAFCLLLPAAFSGTAARAQTDIALGLYGAFSGATTSNFTQESPSNSAGGMIELRHISNPLVGYEATYSYNRANQVYSVAGAPPCPPSGCGIPVSVSANAHEITGDWLISLHAANLRPFALAGIGVLLNEPTSGQSGTQSSTTAVYVYGAGLDWKLLPHLGLRFQYRGNVYKAPDIAPAYSSFGGFKHTAEPMIGAYFRF